MEDRLVCICAFDALVSEDIAACVSEWDRTAAVRVFASHEDTARALARLSSVFALVARGSADELDAFGLPSLVAARGARLVWVSDSPVRTPPWEMDCVQVAVPFTADTLRAALSAAARRTAPPAEA